MTIDKEGMLWIACFDGAQVYINKILSVAVYRTSVEGKARSWVKSHAILFSFSGIYIEKF